MADIISGLNKIFDSRVRLGIMSILAVNDSVDFNTMKDLLDVTDGNLASHLKALEKEEVIEVKKQFIGRKPNTSYSITPLGQKLFKEHIDALEKLINPLS
ncbi:transcriptional regulator [Dysgonomonas sp. 25]|uniref:winged helix-turn-helix domain-containing protein n=1 Tax=Dysgonomonas sp. 25 TaxID=2302933 RepID=UPI0013D68192|nr:transcriptional regulator [Dysgonomonas sp. 25]NDV69602.1 transcriptional regulator [Dysgonomonas sp. 25]